MPVKIRLARRGRKNLPMYSIVIADARAKRDGRFIEKIGTYNPHNRPASIQLKDELAVKWLLQGAQPTDTVRSIFSSQGVMLRKHLQQGVRKGAITQVVADERFSRWQAMHKNKKRPFARIETQTLAVKEVPITQEEQAALQVAEESTEDKEESIAQQAATKPDTTKEVNLNNLQAIQSNKNHPQL